MRKIQNKALAGHELTTKHGLIKGDAEGIFNVADELADTLLKTAGWSAVEPKARVAREVEEIEPEALKQKAGPSEEDLADAAGFVQNLEDFTTRATADDAKMGLAKLTQNIVSIAIDFGRIERVLNDTQRETCNGCIQKLREKLVSAVGAKVAPKMKTGAEGEGKLPPLPPVPPSVADSTTPPTGSPDAAKASETKNG